MNSIWIDSSFAIEWLLGRKSAAQIEIDASLISVLPSQFAEIVTFFQKRDPEFEPWPLEGIGLTQPSRSVLTQAANLFMEARRSGGGEKRSKVSLADAILAAAAHAEGGAVLSYDRDFAQLGLEEEVPGLWKPII